MNQTLDMTGKEIDSLTPDEAIYYIWEWRKYRNQVFWSSMYRWGGAALVLTLIPYVLPDIITKLGVAVLIFPALAALLAVIAAYLMIVQYILYKQVDRKYRSLLGQYTPADMPAHTALYRMFRISIGKVVSGIFLIFALVIQLLNGLVLFWLVRAGRP